ncbi:caveolin-2-like [Megalops cyprinoides]|uniref:caveolin-2-like n=1 Tax=Megalops cyprinoides TaxID=118141 RepID=UPI001863EC4C|nr:caveolin-2-like [Megalops cyprinoides]
MGLENEKSETTVILDEDEFNRSIDPILNQKEKVFTATPDRDPHDINGQLKVGFEDVIAEPSTTHSFDKVWIGSHAVFELAKFVFYRLLTTLLAVPMSFVAGIVFAVLSCVHIWVVMPVVQTCMVALPSIQTIWRSLMDTFVAPLFLSAGRCLSAVNVKGVHD